MKTITFLLLLASAASAQTFSPQGVPVNNSGSSSFNGGSVAGETTFNAPTTCGSDTLTYAATVNIDFSAKPCKSVALTGDVTFTTSNLAAGRELTIIITNANSYHLMTWPAFGWTGAIPRVIGPAGVARCVLRSTGTTNAAVVTTCDGSGVPGVVQRVVTRMRSENISCPSSHTIEGTRRLITTTSGNYLDINYHASGVTGAAEVDANFGISISVDGNQPEFSLRHQHTNASGGGYNMTWNGGARVHISPGVHTIFLACHEFGGDGGGYNFTEGSFAQQEENGLDMTVEEVRETEWWPSLQLPQVLGTDSQVVLWLRADDPANVIDGSSRVTTAHDASSNNLTVTQAISGRRPLLVSNCQNGLPCFRFTEAREDGWDTSLALGGETRVYVVLAHTSQPGKDPPLWDCDRVAEPNCMYVFMGDSGGSHDDKPSVRCGGSYRSRNTATTGVHLMEFRSSFAKNDSATLKDKADEVDTDFSCATPGTMISVGSDTSFDGFQGDIMEVIVVKGANSITLSNTDDNYIRDYLNYRWGTYTTNVGL